MLVLTNTYSYASYTNVIYITGISLASQQIFFNIFVLILIVIDWIACGVCNFSATDSQQSKE